jgi:uncharacterized protein (DUF433 family)
MAAAQTPVRSPEAIPHVWLDQRGVAWVDKTNTKVKEIVRDHAAGLTADQIHEGYPHLTLGQIHAALAYYFDHQVTVDAQLAEDDRFVERLRSEGGESPVVARLRAAGRLK